MSAQPPANDRRRDPRYPVDFRCWIEQETMTLMGTAVNVSRGGIFLRTLPALEKGARVEVKFSLEDGLVRARGQVAWIKEPPRGKTPSSLGSPGLGIEFTEFTSGGERFRRFVLGRSD